MLIFLLCTENASGKPTERFRQTSIVFRLKYNSFFAAINESSVDLRFHYKKSTELRIFNFFYKFNKHRSFFVNHIKYSCIEPASFPDTHALKKILDKELGLQAPCLCIPNLIE